MQFLLSQAYGQARPRHTCAGGTVRAAATEGREVTNDSP
jgi:hypothetical protein